MSVHGSAGTALIDGSFFGDKMSNENILKNKWEVNYRPSYLARRNGNLSAEWKTKSVMAYGSLHAAIKVCSLEKLDLRLTEFRSKKV
jgi:hypothetical protein